MTTFITILGISLLIVLHELGHYAVARACGMRVQRFSVGFGPALLSHRRGDTTWQFALVPLGGYVQIQGMGADDEGPADGRGFRDKARWQRALVLAAGPAANWLVAAVCLAGVAMTVGLRDYAHPTATLGEVEAGTAAAAAGLVPGDRVLEVDAVAVGDWEGLVREVRKHPGRSIPLTIERDGETRVLTATPTPSADGAYGILGVAPEARLVRHRPLAAIGAGVGAAVELTVEQARLLWGVITGRLEGRLSGLPGIVKTLSAQARRGLGRFFETLATLSVVLFILNLAPVPALDGSRLVFLGVEAVRRRPLSERVETIVHGVGLVLLLGLMLFVSVRDLL